MKIYFIHPDLGIGGAERLIVDSAVALTKKKHRVNVFTGYHNRNHCFEGLFVLTKLKDCNQFLQLIMLKFVFIYSFLYCYIFKIKFSYRNKRWYILCESTW